MKWTTHAKNEDLFPIPWYFKWDEGNPPTILASNNHVVCVLPTGTIKGPYKIEYVLQLADKIIYSANSPQFIDTLIYTTTCIDDYLARHPISHDDKIRDLKNYLQGILSTCTGGKK